MLKTQIQLSEWGLLSAFLILSCVLILQWRYRRNQNSPSLYYSDIENVEEIDKSWRVRLIFVPGLLKKTAFMFFLIALCNPILLKPLEEKQNEDPLKEASHPNQGNPQFDSKPIPTEGLAIYFVLDQSGSMREEVEISLRGLGQRRVTRIDALKYFTSQFIKGSDDLGMKGRSDDLIGLIAFARIPKIISPLTLDHEMVQQKLHEFSPVADPKEEGTAIGYAIYKTAHTIAATEHFSRELLGEDKPAYDIKSTVMILVTDGLQNPSHEDLDHPLRSISVEQAAQFAKEKGIRLYIINIQPGIDYPGLKSDRSSQRRAAEMTGGEFFLANDTRALQKIYQVIDGIERNKHHGADRHAMVVEESSKQMQNSQAFDRTSYYTQLITLGLICLLISIILETTLLKKVP